MTPHQHQQLKQWAEDMRPLPGQGYLYDLMHEAIDAVVPQVPSVEDRIIAGLTAFRDAVKPEPTHAEAYAKLNPKVGERFRVVRKVEPEGWKKFWLDGKDQHIGITHECFVTHPDAGVYLCGNWFPANALERVVG